MTPRPQAVVEVRDIKNPDRLLGGFYERPVILGPGCNSMEMAVTPRIPEWNPLEYPLPIRRVRFQVHFRTFDDGYSARAEFRTDAPLATLIQLPMFRLPGETEHSAHLRMRSFW